MARIFPEVTNCDSVSTARPRSVRSLIRIWALFLWCLAGRSEPMSLLGNGAVFPSIDTIAGMVLVRCAVWCSAWNGRPVRQSTATLIQSPSGLTTGSERNRIPNGGPALCRSESLAQRSSRSFGHLQKGSGCRSGVLTPKGVLKTGASDPLRDVPSRKQI